MLSGTDNTLWSRTTRNPDVTSSSVHSFIRSFACSLAPLTHSRTDGKVIYPMLTHQAVLNHNVVAEIPPPQAVLLLFAPDDKSLKQSRNKRDSTVLASCGLSLLPAFCRLPSAAYSPLLSLFCLPSTACSLWSPSQCLLTYAHSKLPGIPMPSLQLAAFCSSLCAALSSTT